VFKRVRNFTSAIYNSIFFLSAAFLLILAAAAFFIMSYQAKNSLVEQTLYREQLVARSGASDVSSFFDIISRSITIQADNPDVKNLTVGVDNSLHSYISHWINTPYVSILLLDREGAVRCKVNNEVLTPICTSLADRKYFIWAETAKNGEVFVSEPGISRTGITKGKTIVTVSSPTFDKNGQFSGVLVGGVLLNDLTIQYLDPLKISDKTRVYLFNQDGMVISSPVDSLLGINYIDYLKGKPFLGAENVAKIFADAMGSGKEGKMDIVLAENSTNKLTRFLVAYSPVEIEGQKWFLAVETPVDDALIFLTPFYVRGIEIIALAFFAILIIGIRAAKIKGYSEGIEDESKVCTKPPSTKIREK
jgi:hypothetical protein